MLRALQKLKAPTGLSSPVGSGLCRGVGKDFFNAFVWRFLLFFVVFFKGLVEALHMPFCLLIFFFDFLMCCFRGFVRPFSSIVPC